MEYRPLRQDEIRVVRLFPNRDIDADLRCEITYRAAKSTYSALSYEWGDVNPPTRILIGQDTFYITPNLDAALRRLRDPEETLDLWIDALCINQADDEEKQAQVGRMHEIYEWARTVFMWLGEEEGDSELGMELIQLAQELTQNQAINEVMNFISNESMNPKWQAVGRILSRSYWTRAWTFQEVACSLNPIVCCGGSRVGFNGLSTILATLGRGNVEWVSTGFTRVSVLAFPNIMPMVKASRLNTLDGSQMSVLDGLVHLRNRQATDPRDKVYAAIQLAKSDGFKTAYDKSMSSVYRDIVEFVIEQDGNLDILSACKCGDSDVYMGLIRKTREQSLQLEGILPMISESKSCGLTPGKVSEPLEDSLTYEDSPKEQQPEVVDYPQIGLASGEAVKIVQEFKHTLDGILDVLLPSWAPDWRRVWLAEKNILLTPNRVPECYYRASYDAKPAVQFADDKRLMMVEGIRVDTITDVLQAYPDHTDSFGPGLSNECELWESLDLSHHVYGDHVCQREAYIHTLTMGIKADGSKGTDDIILDYLNDCFNVGLGGEGEIGGNDQPILNRTVIADMKSMLRDYCFSTTDRGYMGRVPLEARSGDIIVVFLGAKVPHVLRKYAEEDAYFLIGECYLHGIMEGEMMHDQERGYRRLETFNLL